MEFSLVEVECVLVVRTDLRSRFFVLGEIGTRKKPNDVQGALLAIDPPPAEWQHSPLVV